MTALTQQKREEKIKRLNKIASWADSYGADHSVMISALEAKEMAEAYIASLTAEPVVFIHANMLSSMIGEDPRVCGRVWSSSVDELSNEDRISLFTAPPVPEIKLSLLQSRDLEALIRFNETCEDGEGYDLSKDKMDRLVELGVVRKIKGSIREITALGQMYIDINFQDSPSEFLMTETDLAAAFNQHIKRLSGLGE